MKNPGLLLLVALCLSSSARAEETAPYIPGFTQDANVFGADDRKPLRDTSAPWRTIGRVDNPNGGACTATLVGKNLILTAAHCVINPKTRKLYEGTYVFKAGLTDDVPTHTANLKWIWWGTTNPDSQRSHDWALARLDQPLGDQLGWMGVRNTQITNSFHQRNLYLVGYSNELGGSATAHWVGGCSYTGWSYAYDFGLHNCDSSRGFSGGPLFQIENGGGFITGLNVAEFRNGGNVSLIGIPYTDKHANIAVSTSRFLQKLITLKGNNEGL